MSLGHYRNQLKREQDRAVRTQKEIANLSAAIARSQRDLSRSRTDSQRRMYQSKLDRLTDQHVRAEAKYAESQKKIANYAEQITRAEQREQAAEAKRQGQAVRKQRQVQSALERQIASTSNVVVNLSDRVSSIEDMLLSQVHDAVVDDPVKRRHDVFLSYASPDELVAQELYTELSARNLDVWFSKAEVQLGQSLTRKIDRGIAQSRVAVILVTRKFVEGRYWTELELGAFISTRRRIIPVLDGINREALARYSPLLSDFVGLDTKTHGIASIAELIAVALPRSESDEISA